MTRPGAWARSAGSYRSSSITERPLLLLYARTLYRARLLPAHGPGRVDIFEREGM